MKILEEISNNPTPYLLPELGFKQRFWGFGKRRELWELDLLMSVGAFSWKIF